MSATRGRLQHLRPGVHRGNRQNHDRILAVVRGRVHVMLQQGESVARASLRASDAVAIPASTPFSIEALQDTEIYLYAEPAPGPVLWGV